MTYQQIYNFLAKVPYDSFLDKLMFRFFFLLRKLLQKIHDPLIDYKIGNSVISLPFSHNLGIYKNRYPQYSLNIGRLARYIYTKYQNLTVIDVGANVGDTVTILRNHIESPILAIEGNEYFFSILQKNTEKFNNITLAKVLIGEQTQDIKAIMVAHHAETASLKLSQDQGILKMRKLKDLLNENPVFKNSKLLKIDTDGYDGKIIRGSFDWIKEAKPIIFFEYDPFLLNNYSDDGLSLLTWLAESGFSRFLVYNNFGEYMYAVDKEGSILEMHQYFSSRKGKLYSDLCVFSDNDADLFDQIKKEEARLFLTV